MFVVHLFLAHLRSILIPIFFPISLILLPLSILISSPTLPFFLSRYLLLLLLLFLLLLVLLRLVLLPLLPLLLLLCLLLDLCSLHLYLLHRPLLCFTLSPTLIFCLLFSLSLLPNLL